MFCPRPREYRESAPLEWAFGIESWKQQKFGHCMPPTPQNNTSLTDIKCQTMPAPSSCYELWQDETWALRGIFSIARKHDRIIPRICYKKKRKQSSGHHSNYLQIRSWKRRPLTAMFLPVPIKKEHWRAESNIPAFLFLKKGSAQFSAVRSARCIIRLISFYSSVNSGSSVSRVRYKILINRFNVSRLLFETLRPDDDDHLIQPILIQLAVVNQLRLTFRQKNLLVIKKSVTLNWKRLFTVIHSFSMLNCDGRRWWRRQERRRHRWRIRRRCRCFPSTISADANQLGTFHFQRDYLC